MDSATCKISIASTRLRQLEVPASNTEKIKLLTLASRYEYMALESFFEWEGILYKSKISPQTYAREQLDRVKINYFFAGNKFAFQLDRDLAVMLELSRDMQLGTIEDILPDQNCVHRRPVFCLPDGRKIISQKDVAYDIPEGAIIVKKLNDLRHICEYDANNFEFGIEYLAAHGAEA